MNLELCSRYWFFRLKSKQNSLIFNLKFFFSLMISLIFLKRNNSNKEKFSFINFDRNLLKFEFFGLFSNCNLLLEWEKSSSNFNDRVDSPIVIWFQTNLNKIIGKAFWLNFNSLDLFSPECFQFEWSMNWTVKFNLEKKKWKNEIENDFHWKEICWDKILSDFVFHW